MTKPNSKFTAYLPAFLIGLAVICTPLLGLTEPVSGDEVAAVFPPGWDEADVLLASAAAETRLVRFGAFSNVGIIRINGDAALADLRAQGAILLLHPQALGSCFSQPIGQSLATTPHWST